MCNVLNAHSKRVLGARIDAHFMVQGHYCPGFVIARVSVINNHLESSIIFLYKFPNFTIIQ